MIQRRTRKDIMDKLYVLRNESGKYYSDGEFIEPEKEFAQRLRLGQANAIKRNKEKYNFSFTSENGSLISIEEA